MVINAYKFDVTALSGLMKQLAKGQTVNTQHEVR